MTGKRIVFKKNRKNNNKTTCSGIPHLVIDVMWLEASMFSFEWLEVGDMNVSFCAKALGLTCQRQGAHV